MPSRTQRRSLVRAPCCPPYRPAPMPQPLHPFTPAQPPLCYQHLESAHSHAALQPSQVLPAIPTEITSQFLHRNLFPMPAPPSFLRHPLPNFILIFPGSAHCLNRHIPTLIPYQIILARPQHAGAQAQLAATCKNTITAPAERGKVTPEKCGWTERRTSVLVAAAAAGSGQQQGNSCQRKQSMMGRASAGLDCRQPRLQVLFLFRWLRLLYRLHQTVAPAGGQVGIAAGQGRPAAQHYACGLPRSNAWASRAPVSCTSAAQAACCRTAIAPASAAAALPPSATASRPPPPAESCPPGASGAMAAWQIAGEVGPCDGSAGRGANALACEAAAPSPASLPTDEACNAHQASSAQQAARSRAGCCAELSGHRAQRGRTGA